MNAPAILGGFFIGFASLHLALKLLIRWDTAGPFAYDGGVPRLDGLVFPPIFATFGIVTGFVHAPFWVGFLIWLALTAFACGSYAAVDWLGQKGLPFYGRYLQPICRVHHEPLVRSDLAPDAERPTLVGEGRQGGVVRGAERRLFPNASPGHLYPYTLFYCPACDSSRQEWLSQHRSAP